MKKLMMILCTILCANILAAQTFTSGGLNYEIIDNNSVKVARQNSYDISGSVVIPSTVTYDGTTYSVIFIGDYAFGGCSGLTSVTIPNSVTSIGGSAFNSCSGLTSVTIPNNVTSIGGSAFYCCSGLTSVTIPNSVTSIGKSAFSGCSGLTSVTIPTGVTSIGGGAFSHCSSLTSINVASGNTHYSSIDGVLYNYVQNTLIQCPGAKTSVTIPTGVTSIGSSAFYGCSGLTSINVVSGNTHYSSIDGVLYNYVQDTLIQCPGAKTSVTIPNSVTSIGYGAFYGCSGLTSATIPNSVTSIGEGAFWDCSGLTSVTIGNSVTSIGRWAFSGCSSLTTLNFDAINYPDVVSTDDYFSVSPFTGTALTTVNIGDSVQRIPANIFRGCINLTTLNFNAINCHFQRLTSYGYGSSYCPFDGIPLTTVNIGDSVQRIPNNFVRGCGGLTSVTIPNSVTSIGDSAFENCSGLTSVTIGNRVTSIGNSAFKYCSGLTTLNFNAIDCQDFEAYYYTFDTSLTTVNIGDSVQRIPNNFVSGCSGLTEITIPENVTSIGDNVFAGCSNLTTLNFNAINCRDFGYRYNSSSVSPFGDHLTTVNIGDSVQRIPSYFVYGNGLTEITIPEKVEKIGGGAFCNCGLTTLNFNAVNCQDLYRYYDPYLRDNRYVSPFDTSLTTINIGNSVQRIPYYFVVSCHRLTSVTIPKNVTSIRNGAFIDCGLTTLNFNARNCQDFEADYYYNYYNPFGTSLTTVNIGDSVQRIPAYFVSSCSGLTSVTIPESVTEIGGYAFYGCTGLPSSLTIPKNVTSIGYAAFVGCGLTALNFNAINCQDFTNNNYYGSDCPFDTTLTTVNIGDSVQRIPANFARNCGELTSIEFPVNIHTIGVRAFDGCKSLTSITIPEMVDTIDSYAFANCDSLTMLNFNAVNCNMVGTYYIVVDEDTWEGSECSSLGRNLSAVNIGSNVQRIPDNFLYGCTELDSIIIPSSVTTIGRNAFNSCTGLTSVGLPEGLTSIGDYAFSGCSGLTSITIPNGVTSIEPNTFYGCTGLASINLPEGLVSIGDGAFANCSSLSALTIPSTVSSIGSEATGTGAFSGCTGLSSITSMAYYPPILSNVNTFPFAAIRNIPVHIPCGSSMNYRYAAYWNSFINIQDAMLYQLDLLVNDTTWGSATYSCVQFGTSLTAIPKNGATFVRWNDGNTENPRTVTITTDTTFTAIFGGHATYTVSVEPNNPAMGSVTGGGTFDDGSATTISATPFTGYHFVSWSDGNADNPRTVTVESNITYTAVFAPNIYSVTAEVQNPSMGSVNGGGSYNYNSNVTLTAMPNSCSRFVSWTDGNTENPRTITVVSDTTLTAMFEGVDYAGSITAAICEGSTYAWNGSDISEAGTYTQTLQAVNGCDSTVTLTLTVNPVASTTLSATICEGSTYTENGFNASEAGTYTQTLQTVNGCDSIVTLSLTVNPVENTNLSAAICEGSVYTENGFNASEAGTYTQNLQTVNGCDSIVTLNLTISNVVNNDITAAICEGSVYTENGFNASEAGIYTQNLQTTNGCDSIVTLTLSVNPVENTNLSAAICEGSVYTENGFNASEAGTHTLNLQTINGCDSIVTLTLTVNPVANTTLSAAICEGSTYTENGFNESETGTYTQNLQTVNGCDSIVTLNLTVSTVINNDITAAICEGSTYTENGFNVSEPGSYTQNLQSVNGCDSVVTLTLTVNPTYNITIDANINEGETYEENGFSESEAGTYVHTLQAENGCDSVITLNLTVNSSLNDIVASAIEVSLYPNPANAYTTLKVEGLKEQTPVYLFDIQGRKLKEYVLNAAQQTLRIDVSDLPKGVYTIMLGNTTKKLIVE